MGKNKKNGKKRDTTAGTQTVARSGHGANGDGGNGVALDRGTNAKGMTRKQFEAALEPLQVELVKVQEWTKRTGAKICVVFEGRDTAGKGGVIKHITERVSPRVFRVIALPTPTEREQ